MPTENEFVTGTKHYLKRLSYGLLDINEAGQTKKDEKISKKV